MRLLHTSDWHVGRTFHGQSLLADQEAVLGAIADLVEEHSVDVVIVAGDIYDRAVPSADAVQLATRVLMRIRRAGAVIIASSGNHDSAPRLGAFSDFLAAGGLYLRTCVQDLSTPVVLTDTHGPVVFYPVPYLEPELVRRELAVAGPAGHQSVLSAAMGSIRADLSRWPTGTRSVVVAHAFVVGAIAGGSERSIAVGGVESVTADVFAGFDYVALGHLHGAQAISQTCRYSGSPLAYSFGEAAHRKSVTIVDLALPGAVSVRTVDLPVVRALAVVRGTLADILSGHPELHEHYLSVVLTDRIRPIDPMRRLKERFPFALKLAWEPPGAPADADPPLVGGRDTDQEVFSAFLRDCRGSGPAAFEENLIDRALAGARAAALTG